MLYEDVWLSNKSVAMCSNACKTPVFSSISLSWIFVDHEEEQAVLL